MILNNMGSLGGGGVEESRGECIRGEGGGGPPAVHELCGFIINFWGRRKHFLLGTGVGTY